MSQSRPQAGPSERGSCAEAPGAETGNKDQAMTIERTTFGAITVDGKTYEHDVIIRLSGEVVKRKKKLSKKYYGTSHVLSKDEAKFVFEKGCKQLILGSGQMGNVHLSPEAEAYFAKKGCKVLLQPTSKAIRMFNRSHARKVGLFHDLLRRAGAGREHCSDVCFGAMDEVRRPTIALWARLRHSGAVSE
jgi:hypothetical protein